MEEDVKMKEKPIEKEKVNDKIDVDVSIAAINPDDFTKLESKTSGRARTRSIWGRKKEKPALG